MKSADVQAMLDEYNKGSYFADYVNRCAEAHNIDAMTVIHKAITFEYFKYVVGYNCGANRDGNK